MAYKESKDLKFVNPYTFIGVQQAKSGDSETVGTLSGVLHCTLETKTPLAVPDVESKREEDEHPCYSFMMVNDVAIIPGSSLRGMFRSMYETLTGSCYVTMGENYALTKRVEASGAYKPGLLIRSVDGKWELYEASRYALYYKGKHRVEGVKSATVPVGDKRERVIKYNQITFYLGDKITFISKRDGKMKLVDKIVPPEDIVSDEDEKNRKEGYIFVGESSEIKKAEGIFVKGVRSDLKPEEIKRAMSMLEKTVECYQSSSINQKLDEEDHYGYRGYRRALEKGVLPVWYDPKDKSHLSLAAVGRTTFNKFLNEMGPEGEYFAPCKTRKNACPACHLFGMMKDEASVGRVRFSDATGKNVHMKRAVTLKELASPRTGFLQFYSERGMVYDAEGASIRGRKFYWHSPNAEQDSSCYETDNKTKRNATMDLVDSHSSFDFDVYFDELTQQEYDELVWLLFLDRGCYKLGHGKPLGLGSVQVTVQKCEMRSYSAESGYSINAQEVCFPKNVPGRFLAEIVDQVKVVSDFKYIAEGIEIRYPYIENSGVEITDKNKNDLASFHWFAEAKKSREKLPGVMDEDQTLHAYVLYADPDKKENDQKEKGILPARQQLIVGQEYTGTVGKRKNNPKFVVIKLDGGGTASVFDGKQKLQEGEKVKVKYLGVSVGKDGNQYANWELV